MLTNFLMIKEIIGRSALLVFPMFAPASCLCRVPFLQWCKYQHLFTLPFLQMMDATPSLPVEVSPSTHLGCVIFGGGPKTVFHMFCFAELHFEAPVGHKMLTASVIIARDLLVAVGQTGSEAGQTEEVSDHSTPIFLDSNPVENV